MDRRKRELLKLAEGEGLQAVVITTNGSTHYKVEGAVGQTRVYIVAPCSAGDHRNILNLRGALRRKIREAKEALSA